jgi:nicotinamidase-related amidase
MRTALIVIDMLNRYEHDDAELLIASVHQVLPAMSELVKQARECNIPLIYVNDNYEDWTASRDGLCKRALEGPNQSLVEPVLPPPDAAFLTKARHSIFYETQLEYMLRSLSIERVVLIGQVTEQCILYSALDAYVRHYAIVIPRNAVAHIHPDLADAALRMMQINMKAHITGDPSLFVRAKGG